MGAVCRVPRQFLLTVLCRTCRVSLLAVLVFSTGRDLGLDAPDCLNPALGAVGCRMGFLAERHSKFLQTDRLRTMELTDTSYEVRDNTPTAQRIRRRQPWKEKEGSFRSTIIL
ncbi:hypothetical protein B0T26DRAFT_686115, partial [Lasiosphaeria miniovina]